MKLSDYVADFLARYTRHVFVGNGGCIIHVLHSIEKHKKLTNVPCENEQGAAIAAEAYSRVSGKLGVAVATSGPGMANLLQGIACAFFDSIPTLYISGAAPTSQLRMGSRVRQMGFQEMEVVGIVQPVTKYAVLVTDPLRIRYELEKLVFLAYEGRPGPVLLDLPDDLQRAEIDPEKLEGYKPRKQVFAVKEETLRRVTAMIAKARRPVVVAGGGIKLAGAERHLRMFLKKTGLPVAPTWAAIDLFCEDTPDLIGDFGISAGRAGNFAVQNADLILSLGSRLDTHQTGGKPQTFAPRARKIMVDIDPHELSKDNGMTIDLPIHCDLRTFLESLNRQRITVADLKPWKARIAAWRTAYPICPEENYRQKSKVDPYVFMNELSRLTGAGDIIITDTGCTLSWTMQGYKIRRRQMLFSAFNHSPMGYALPASIGAQFASPRKRVICLNGDGGLQMNIQELETIAYNRLPVKIFVINNRGYGMIKQTQDTWLDSCYVASDESSGLGFPDYQKLAWAYGIKAVEIDSHKKLKKKLKKVLAYKGPVLCDVQVKPCARIIPKLDFGRPIEDSSPLLSRKEFERNMRIS